MNTSLTSSHLSHLRCATLAIALASAGASTLAMPPLADPGRRVVIESTAPVEGAAATCFWTFILGTGWVYTCRHFIE